MGISLNKNSNNMLSKTIISASMVTATLATPILTRDMPVKIPGRCPEIHGTSNFNVDEYTGRWYNIANLPFFWMDGNNLCPWANYTKWTEVDPSVPYDIRVINSEIDYKTNERTYSAGNAYVNRYEPVLWTLLSDQSSQCKLEPTIKLLIPIM